MKKLNKELEQVLRSEWERMQDRRKSISDELIQLREELEALDDQMEHVKALLQYIPGDDGLRLALEVAQQPVAQTGNHSDDPVELAHSVLEGRSGEPVHYRELADLVMQRGGELGGQDPAQALVSRMVRDDRFVRPHRRGWYALRMHFPRVKSVGARKKPPRRRAAGSRTA